MTAGAVTMTTSAHHGPRAAARRPAGCAMGERGREMRFVPTAAMGDRCRDGARADRSCRRPHVVCCPRPPARGPRPRARCRASVWPLDLVRVFTHGRRTGPCAIARAPGPTAKARVSLHTAEHYVAVERIEPRYAFVAPEARAIHGFLIHDFRSLPKSRNRITNQESTIKNCEGASSINPA